MGDDEWALTHGGPDDLLANTMGFAFDLNLGDLLGSAFTAAVGLFLLRRTSGVEAEVKNLAERDMKLFESVHTHKQRALEELLGPVAMQLRRTQIASKRWTKEDLGLESKIIRAGNQTVRDVLLTKVLAAFEALRRELYEPVEKHPG